MKAALHNFDQALPGLKRLRDVGEHIGEYSVDGASRHDKTVIHEQVRVGSWDGTVYEWLDVRLNVLDALVAAEELYGTLRIAMKKVDHPQR